MSLDISTPSAGALPPVDEGMDTILRIARARRRNSLVSAAVLLVLFMGFIVLTTSTTVLSGRIGGLGVAYWVGFAIFAAVLVVAQIYVRWAKRMDVLIDAHLRELDDVKAGA